MMDVIAVTLRVISADHASAEIERAVGRSADRTLERGDLMYPSNPRSMRSEASICLYDSGVLRSEPFEEHIPPLLELVTPRLAAFEVDILCGLSSDNGQGGVSLEPALMKQLADAGVTIVFDVMLG